jgi:hypothetical protein
MMGGDTQHLQAGLITRKLVPLVSKKEKMVSIFIETCWSRISILFGTWRGPESQQSVNHETYFDLD